MKVHALGLINLLSPSWMTTTATGVWTVSSLLLLERKTRNRSSPSTTSSCSMGMLTHLVVPESGVNVRCALTLWKSSGAVKINTNKN